MIQYGTYLTKDSDCCVLKSINDKKKYRFFKLENGLKVFIIQDERKMSTDDRCDEVRESEKKRIRLSVDQDMDSASESSNDSKVGEDKMSAMALCVNVGGFSDPKELQGLAHFTEHVVLMGNEEYPTVNEFDSYVSSRCGSLNAHTENEYTTYEAQIPNSYLDGCLKRFAACFKSPLFRPKHIETEINPVNNEFKDLFVDDDVRCEHFVCACLAKKDHVFSNFICGNITSLKELPESEGISVREKMVEFFDRYYKASRMTLVIQSQESLDSVEKLVRQYFKDLPTEANNDPTPDQLDEEKLVQELLSNNNVFAKKEYPFASETFAHLYKVDSIEDGHTLRLIYTYPPVAKLFKSKPLHTLGSILGYEGKNSLIQFLIKKKLVLEFITSHDDSCMFQASQNYHSLLCLIVKLTDEGLEKVDLVVRYINYYIDLMVREGPQEQFYNEERLISLTDIRFEDEVLPLTNVVDLSKNLLMYPVEYAIIGPKLLYEFNRDAVKYCLDYLKVQPRLSIIVSKKAYNASNRPAQFDFFSDVEYKIEPLPAQWINPMIESEDLVSNLKLPPPNEFISSDFEIKSQDCFYSTPIVIDEDSHYKCFFKNDNVFKTPKACIYLFYQSDYIRQNPEAIASLEFYIKYFMLVITEQTYPAQQCGLQFSVNIVNRGLEVKVIGFNSKLSKLLRLLIDQLIGFKIEPTLFDTIKMDLIREYYNTLISNDEFVHNIVSHLLLKNTELITKQREIVKMLNIETLIGHVIAFFTTSYCQCLIQGNYTRSEAQEIFEYVKSTLVSNREQVNFDQIRKTYTHQVPIGRHYCYLKSFNKVDENLLVYNDYELGRLSKDEIGMLEVLMQEMSDPLFNLLRNEQTLAYCLYCKFSKTRDDICAFQIVIKSLADKFTPQYVDQQIEWFIDHFANEKILKMTEEYFKELIAALIKRKQVPFVSLNKEANHCWTEILTSTYRFDKKKEQIEVLKKLQFDKFVQFAESILKQTDERIRKLSVCSIGTGAKSEELFTCSNDVDVIAGNEDEEFNNDKTAYSLIYMKPKELDVDCNLIENVEKWTADRSCWI